ncbi:MAG: M48 family metallopeptidase [Opitutales bacterium]|nr:M48 family metallopeptidase [Opitutales bacterium]
MIKSIFRGFSVVAAVVVACVMSGCATGPAWIPDSFLNNMAAQQFAQMQQEMPVSRNPESLGMVERIANRMADVVDEDMPGAVWEYVVFDSPQINAFAMPGGRIGIFQGLIDIVESEDELAIVIGHELAHVMQRHSNQRLTAQLIALGGTALVGYAASRQESIDPQLAMAAFGLGTQVGILLPFSRAHEYEADQIGLFLAARAGYDPRAAIPLWQRMEGMAGQGSPPEYLSTHPSFGNRIQRLEALMPKALELREEAEARRFLRERGQL